MVFEFMEHGDLADLLRRTDATLNHEKPVTLKVVSAKVDCSFY